MNHDLIERYIYAVTKRLPVRQREDVARELRGLIDDMLTERCGNVTPAEKDIRIILMELGTPQELYAKYDETADQCLIGQPYFTTYKSVLRIVLIAAAAGITIARGIQWILEPQDWLTTVTSWLTMVYQCLLAGFTIVTLLFAFFSRKGIRINESFNFDELPPVPRKGQQIPRWECFAGIIFCVLFVVLFLCVPQVLGFYTGADGARYTMFDVVALRRTWYIIVGFAVCGIIREVIELLEGRYSKRVLIAAAAANTISAILSIWWLAFHDLIHPGFVANVSAIFPGENRIVIGLFSNFQNFFLAVILFALVLDTVDVVVKTIRK